MSGGSQQGRKSAARRLGHRAACPEQPAQPARPESRGAGGVSGEQRGGDTQAGRVGQAGSTRLDAL